MTVLLASKEGAKGLEVQGHSKLHRELIRVLKQKANQDPERVPSLGPWVQAQATADNINTTTTSIIQ